MKKRKKDSLSPSELKKHNVKLLLNTGFQIWLRCENCGVKWTVDNPEQRLPRGFWKCPNGCN